jgi:hypothetical protein
MVAPCWSESWNYGALVPTAAWQENHAFTPNTTLLVS